MQDKDGKYLPGEQRVKCERDGETETEIISLCNCFLLLSMMVGNEGYASFQIYAKLLNLLK